MNKTGNRLANMADYLSLERNVTIASAAVFMIGLGEELWKKYLPKYLEALGASTPVIGLFGTAENFLDAVYQYPGGLLADRVGRRRSFAVFVALAAAGYLAYLFSRSWPIVFVGLAFAMAWQSMASPAIFAIIGDSLPPERRAMGFTIQSILKRVPIVIAPMIGGAMIGALGVVRGIHVGLIITLFLAAVTFLLIQTINVEIRVAKATNIRGVWKSFHSALKRLLISDVIIRMCEGLSGVFTILYVTNVHGLSTARYGTLIAVQMITSIVVYIPAGKIADRVGRKPVVIVTFLSFAFFAGGDSCEKLFAARNCLYHRRLTRDWGTGAQGNDRGLCQRGSASAVRRTLLSGPQLVDHTGGRDRWTLVEILSGGTLCRRFRDRSARYDCLCRDRRRTIRQLDITGNPV